MYSSLLFLLEFFFSQYLVQIMFDQYYCSSCWVDIFIILFCIIKFKLYISMSRGLVYEKCVVLGQRFLDMFWNCISKIIVSKILFSLQVLAMLFIPLLILLNISNHFFWHLMIIFLCLMIFIKLRLKNLLEEFNCNFLKYREIFLLFS